MNTKKILLFILIIIVGQLIFSFWTIEGAVIKDEEASFGRARAALALKFLVITFAVKLAGDFLGKFVFKFPGYDWMYIRDYIKEELFATLGLYFAFAVVWFASAFLIFYIKDIKLFLSVFCGGLLPAIYYMFIGTYDFVEKDVTEKRMSRKI